MSKPLKAVYPGTFDPITNGHIDVINRALSLFPELVIAVYDNPKKKTLFPLDKRVSMVERSLGKLGKDLKVDNFVDTLLVDFCKKNSIKVIVRGLRAITDFEYEFQMDHINQLLNHDIETVFFMTSHQYSYLSSSMVKEVAQLGGNIKQFVPASVVLELAKVFGDK